MKKLLRALHAALGLTKLVPDSSLHLVHARVQPRELVASYAKPK